MEWCPLCRLMLIDSQLATAKVPLVGAAYLGWTLGEKELKKRLCGEHRQEYDSLLSRALTHLGRGSVG